MRVRLDLFMETTAFELGAEDSSEVKRALAHKLRQTADRIERMNPDNILAEIVDDLTETRLGHITIDIREEPAR